MINRRKQSLYKGALIVNYIIMGLVCVSAFMISIWVFAISYALIFAAIMTLIPLAWIIPMTIATKKAATQVGTSSEREHLVLAVCSFLFIFILSGIFLLLIYSMNNEESTASKNL